MKTEELIRAIEEMDWEFIEADTQYLTHNIHRYSGKFIPQIAGKVIELITEPDDLVLDSYVGSGTTLLEALLRNRNSIGVDLNPLAILISKVKTTIISDDIKREINDTLIPFVKSLLLGCQLSLIDFEYDKARVDRHIIDNSWRLNDPWNKKWYQPDVLNQLVKIYSCIESIQSEAAKNIALVAFSDILRKSSNASSKYPNVMYDKGAKKKTLPTKPFLDSLSYVIAAVSEMSACVKNNLARTTILLHNNLDLPLNDESIDAIISHPPYIAAIPYAEYGCLSLNWLGYDSKQIDLELTGGRRHSSQVVNRFCEDYAMFFVESYRVLKPNHQMFLMVGNPVSHGEKVDLCALTIDYAKKAGFKHLKTAIRKGQNRRGNKMGEEYLIFFHK